MLPTDARTMDQVSAETPSLRARPGRPRQERDVLRRKRGYPQHVASTTTYRRMHRAIDFEGRVLRRHDAVSVPDASQDAIVTMSALHHLTESDALQVAVNAGAAFAAPTRTDPGGRLIAVRSCVPDWVRLCRAV